MLSLVFVILILEDFLLLSATDHKCFWRIKQNDNGDGDVEDDCFFYIYTKQGPLVNDHFSGNLHAQLTATNIHLILSLFFAIKQINRNIHVLPNISLMVEVSCAKKKDLQTISVFSNKDAIIPNFNCRRERRLFTVLTGPSWFSSITLGPLLHIFTIPQLYYGPFPPLLSDCERFPYLYQISPKHTFLSLAMMALMIHFGWNWVGLVIPDDDPGIQFLSELREEMHKHRICLAFVNVITGNRDQKRTETYYNQIMTSSAKVIIIYGDTDSALTLHFRLWQHLGIQRLWITTSWWDMTTSKGEFPKNSFHGTLILSHHHSEISGFKKFIQTVEPSNYSKDISLGRLWWMYFNCSLSSHCNTLKNCSTKILLEWLSRNQFEVSMRETSYNLYNAVYAVSYALHEMLVEQIVTSPENIGKRLEFYPWQMAPFLENNQFINPREQINMNHKGKLDTEYDILYIMNFLPGLGLKVKIGRFSKHFLHGQQLFMAEDMIEWTMDIRQTPPSVCSMPCKAGFRKSLWEGKAVCCFDCTPCPENEISNMTDTDQCVKCPHDQYANTEQTHCLKKVVTFLTYEDPSGTALACLALCFSVLTAVILGVFLKHQDTPIVKANNRVLSYVLLISLIFCFLCPLLYIGHPHMATCILQQTTFAIVFTVAVSTILAKTITVVMAFKITDPRKKMRWLLLSGTPNYIVPICTMIQLILCGIWLGTFPPFVDTDPHFEYGHIIIVCNKGSIIAFYCVLGYLGLLALGTFTVAFLARNLPDTFNEAKFLTFSMLVFCSVWVTFLPVYHSTKGKAMVVVEIFSILASSAGLLVCIFAPKCFSILLRPEKKFVPKFRGMYSKTDNIP
ncbi:vomeronasal type-2 receptor 116-like [Peromyscus californicus insignis]|uniref:vomeronasal type-2 receptor 116-like n=1 Tax=Peromyscus californicus insignis TaxID=564181 RepID=UPI0022A6AB33|nr:vomeronasal type-2 receptor 116-like [Peromyscus californicus insignis]